MQKPLHTNLAQAFTFAAIISFMMLSNVEGGLASLPGIKTQKPRLPEDLALDLDPRDGLRDSCFPQRR